MWEKNREIDHSIIISVSTSEKWKNYKYTQYIVYTYILYIYSVYKANIDIFEEINISNTIIVGDFRIPFILMKGYPKRKTLGKSKSEQSYRLDRLSRYLKSVLSYSVASTHTCRGLRTSAPNWANMNPRFRERHLIQRSKAETEREHLIPSSGFHVWMKMYVPPHRNITYMNTYIF